MGTIGYMSLEQLLDQEVTTASDIYSLGIIFYETVCGRRAFAAESEVQIIQKILEEMPAPPATIRADVPAALSLLIMQMLEKDAGSRPNLDDFQVQLRI